ncbi:MAG: 2OG-Fe(II) oxygenase [Polymorphobacter sp.]
MFQVTRADVRSQPYPHAISETFLDPDLYRRLRADYPTGATFVTSDSETHGAGSRSGVGTGFDIYRGDSAYDALVAASPAWAEFDAFINSTAFTRKFIELFGPDLEAAGCSIDVAGSTYNHDYVEPRALLTETATIGDRVSALSHKLLRGFNTHRKVELFSRLDIQKSIGGYRKPPHCDRPNRLCSLVLYFTDAEKAGLEGGDLLIYKHKTAKAPESYERHPAESDVEVIATLKPKENLGIWFACSNNSYHGVTPITSQGVERDFLYINISGRADNLW